jgi:SAM-dependent methyltransferase
MNALAPRLVESLRCPVCYTKIRLDRGEAVCTEGHHYLVARGVPVLIDAAQSLFDPQVIAAANSTPTRGSRLGRFLPSMSKNISAPSNYKSLTQQLLLQDDNPLVLNIGGGEGGAGQKELEDSRLEVVLTDVAIGESTQIAADAHRLPFADGTFDGVIAQAVLEHVVDPWTCTEEIYRVLKPSGLVYAETPFMQQVHMGRYDFTRFTALGHRRLFRRFEQIDAGMAVGVGSALGWSLSYFVASLAKNKRARRLLAALGRVLFFWLRSFDTILNTDSATDAAGGFYFLGRKSEVVLSDRDLIKQYPGGMTL